MRAGKLVRSDESQPWANLMQTVDIEHPLKDLCWCTWIYSYEELSQNLFIYFCGNGEQRYPSV